MQPEIVNKTKAPSEKIYSKKAIWFGSFLGGPLSAGYFLASNFKSFGQQNRVRNTWMVAVVATAVLIAILYFLPDDINIPNSLIPLLTAAAAGYIADCTQGREIEAFAAAGGSFHKWWNTALISIGLAIALFVPLVTVAAIADSISAPAYTARAYGTTKNEITFDVKEMSVAEADALAAAFAETEFFNDKFTRYVLVEKSGSTYIIYLELIEGAVDNPAWMLALVKIKDEMTKLLPRHTFVFKIVDGGVENVLKTI